MKERLVIATVKSWNVRNAIKFIADNSLRYDIRLVTDWRRLTFHRMKTFNPRFILFPHWSWKIPEEIYSSFECVVFHMTDLPFGRGGSPLQNLIMRGLSGTKISAIRAIREMDSGPVYMKTSLRLHGSAEEIYERFSKIVFSKMIPSLLSERRLPKPQEGVPVLFKRRRPEDSLLPPGLNVTALYDFIRMLDAEGYPQAFLETGKLRMTFSGAHLRKDTLAAKVLVRLKEPLCSKKSL